MQHPRLSARFLEFDGRKLKLVDASQSPTDKDTILLDPKLPKIGPSKTILREEPESPTWRPRKNMLHNMDFFSCILKASYKNRLSDKQALDRQTGIDTSAKYQEKIILLSKKHLKKEAGYVSKLVQDGHYILDKAYSHRRQGAISHGIHSKSLSHSDSRIASPSQSLGLNKSHRILSHSRISSLSGLVPNVTNPQYEEFEVFSTDLINKINGSIARDHVDEIKKHFSRKPGPSKDKQKAQILKELERQGKPKPWEVDLKETQAYLKFSPNVVGDDPYDMLISSKKPDQESKLDKMKKSSKFLRSIIKKSPKTASENVDDLPVELPEPFPLMEELSKKEKLELSSSGCLDILASMSSLHDKIVTQGYPALFQAGDLAKSNFKRKAKLYSFFDKKQQLIKSIIHDEIPEYEPYVSNRVNTSTISSLGDLPPTGSSHVNSGGPYVGGWDSSVHRLSRGSSRKIRSISLKSRTRLPSVEQFAHRAQGIIKQLEGLTTTETPIDKLTDDLLD
jgi:hypothetical protein